jgi:serine/threonine-protein kinase RsbT
MSLVATTRDDELVVAITSESDLNHARMVARETCKLVSIRGYQAQKVVTTVSELARNIARYAKSGRVRFRVDTSDEMIVIVAEDDGPGISNLDEILAGEYRSRTGLGRGLLGSRDLADLFDIQTSPAGTIVKIAFSYSQRKPWTTSTT